VWGSLPLSIRCLTPLRRRSCTKRCSGRQPGVELRPECVLGCRSQAERRSEVSRTPRRASQRQNTIACDVASAVSKPRDGDGPHPSGKCRMTCYRPHDLPPVVIDHPLSRLADAEIDARAVQAAG